jgi:ankyrin repeat protein
VAYYYGHIEIAKLLIANKADVRATDPNGFTVLHNASSNGDIEIMRLLLAEGADVNAVSNVSGSTPLHCACLGSSPDFERNIEAIKLLIQEGADVNAKDNKQHKPLELANRNVDLAKLIIPNTLLKRPEQEKPDRLKKKEEVSLFWDKQVEKNASLVKELGYQLTSDIFKKITSQQKNTTLCSLAYQFFKPATIEQSISEPSKIVSNPTPSYG